MIHHRSLTGDYDTTIYTVARRLLADGVDPADYVAVCRGGVLSMSGNIGELAKWMVSESKAGGMRLVRWVPPPSCKPPPVAGKSALAGMVAP
jgi:hypothetical protein